ncbi:MAG: leucine-rich repeat protein [Methanomassiliicoccales archaeon]|nr:leucine-rich repeat protein [Methanomassiliicoccales archaeon]
MSIGLAVVMLSSSFVIAVPRIAEGYVFGSEYDYDFIDGGAAIEVMNYHGPGGMVTVPGEIDGYPVRSIRAYTFLDQYSVTSVTISENITSIGEGAFFSCWNMTSLEIGRDVTNIGLKAFFGCSSLISVAIPENVSSIGQAAFSRCSLLSQMIVDASNLYYTSKDGGLYSEAFTTFLQYPVGRTETSFAVPNTVERIGDSAFAGSLSLVNIDLPENLRIVGNFSFADCVSLASVIVPDNVTFLGDDAFYQCTSLTTAVVGDDVTYLRAETFAYCSALTSATLGDNLDTIGIYAFYFCTSLPSIILPDNVTTIHYYAFVCCTSLTSITFGAKLDSIWDYAFSTCSSLIELVFPANVTSISAGAFFRCNSLTSITFLGAVAPSVGWDWVAETNPALAGHAYSFSDFPRPGESFNGLLMGHNIPSSPGAPGNLTGTPLSERVVLSWSVPVDGGSDEITVYRVYRSESEAGPYVLIASPIQTSCVDLGLTNGQIYWYRVSAMNVVGEGAPTGAASFVPNLTVPIAPTLISVVSGNGSLDVTWSAPEDDGGTPVTAHRIYWNATGSSDNGSIMVGAPSVSCELTRLSENTTYSVHVTAINAIGEGPSSSSESAMPTTLPRAPTIRDGYPYFISEALIYWNNNGNGSSPLIEYRVYRSTSATGGYVLAGSVPYEGYNDRGLTYGQTYWYKVSAVNLAGEGAQSNAFAVTIEMPGYTVHESDMGYSLLVPDSWTITDDTTVSGIHVDTIIYGPILGGGQTNVNVIVSQDGSIVETQEWLSSYITKVMEKYAEMGMPVTQTYPAQYLNVSGHLAVLYYYYYQNAPMYQWQLVVVDQHSKRIWVVTCTEANVDSVRTQIEPIFYTMVESFNITSTTAGDTPSDFAWLIVIGLPVVAALGTVAVYHFTGMKCPRCGKRMKRGSTVCPICAEQSSGVAMRFCDQCGSELGDAGICLNCGKKMT